MGKTAGMLISSSAAAQSATPPANDGTLAADNPAATDGRPDDEYGEDTGDMRRALADDLIVRLKRAEILGDVTAAERELAGHRDALPADLVDLIDAEIATAKARVGRK